MTALARWCYRHRYVVLALWLALLVTLGAVTAARGTSYSDEFSLPGTESSKALELLEQASPDQAGDTAQIVLHAESGSITDAALEQRAAPMLAEVAQLPHVVSVTGPYDEAGAGQVSQDGTIAFATVQFDGLAADIPVEDIDKVIDTAQAADGDGLQVELGGQAVQSQEIGGVAEIIGVVAAAIILFIAFGSLFASLMPILVALFGVGVGIMAIGQLSFGMSLSQIAPTLAALIGLGVGIDYALFIVTRFRNGLKSGLQPEEATARALNTSGRAVLFAGGTVVIALLGLLVLNVSFLAGMGVGAAITVLATVAAAITLLPAALGFFGMRLLSRRERRQLAENGPSASHAQEGFWGRWAHRIANRKALFGVVATAMIVVLSLPALSVRLGLSDAGNDPETSTTRQAYDLLAEGFGPGSNGPLLLVAELGDDSDAQALTSLATTLQQTPGVAAVTAVPTQPGATIGMIQVIPTSSPQDEKTSELIQRLRDDVIPPAENGTTMQVHVGGATAIFDDFADVLTSKLPLFIGVIIGLGFLLLLLAFRSIVVPLTAAVMNLIAAAASFGVLVAVFQWGWGSELIGAGPGGPVEAFLPVIMLAILFGLSMDYQVFLVSRMHEEWTHTRDNARAVTVGQAETGRVITAAALIMIFVFAAFILEGQRVIAEFGVGLAAAVAIDAFLIRTILVPAVMHSLGNANWWLPGWLDRILPHLSVDPADEPLPEETAGEPPAAELVSR
ncbi:MMPL family transporter [Kineosporia succinea]|uniref:RND superfamily putative drug exporter n=1 Tax=Kineosporia succinea TaxID=84632 RepID=A0ABT9P031_9ACTN|nr:MMPL family transporter [Kineosporia succinea]MDP9825872.1 RND superfamily putative drug exporter [Kineosporia succinea]